MSSKVYKDVTEDVLQELCKHIEGALSTTQACGIVGVRHKDLDELEAEETERGYRAAAMLARARAEAAGKVIRQMWALIGAKQGDQKLLNVKLNGLDRILRLVDPRAKDKDKGAGGALVVIVDLAGPGQAQVRVVGQKGYTDPNITLERPSDVPQLVAGIEVKPDG